VDVIDLRAGEWRMQNGENKRRVKMKGKVAGEELRVAGGERRVGGDGEARVGIPIKFPDGSVCSDEGQSAQFVCQLIRRDTETPRQTLSNQPEQGEATPVMHESGPKGRVIESGHVFWRTGWLFR